MTIHWSHSCFETREDLEEGEIGEMGPSFMFYLERVALTFID
jgi:hypothetical protein